MAEQRDIGLFTALVERRTIRKFTQEPVEFEKVMEIIEAGTHAPSSGNLQNWSFIVITDKKKLRELFSYTLEQESCNQAQVGIIVCGDMDIAEKYYGLRGKRLYTIQNCAACIQNMLLAAHALGLGANWIGAFDEEKVGVMFSIPPHIRAQAILLLGYPDEKPPVPARKPTERLLYFNKYGERIEFPHRMFRTYSVEWERQADLAKQALRRAANKQAVQQTIARKKVATKDFFRSASKHISKALQSLKDEQKQKRR